MEEASTIGAGRTATEIKVNVDSTLQNDLFELDGGRAKGVHEDAAQLLQMNSSIGNVDA
jgi:hypothetical protein